MGLDLHSTRCAICDTEGNATELYASNCDLQKLTPALFSARRLPDGVHYRIVKCNECGLVRSDPVADSKTLGRLYQESALTYGDEIDNLKRTYGRYLSRLERYNFRKGTLLEIGCGSGFLLEEALAQGYVDVRGIEPSSKAIDAADPSVRSKILCGMMRPGMFEPHQISVICMFQVLDHIDDPGSMLDECFRILERGGVVLCLNHNIEAVSARLLKERSPVVDIEHTYLYSPATITRLFGKHGFDVRKVATAYNTYSLHYLTRL